MSSLQPSIIISDREDYTRDVDAVVDIVSQMGLNSYLPLEENHQYAPTTPSMGTLAESDSNNNQKDVGSDNSQTETESFGSNPSPLGSDNPSTQTPSPTPSDPSWHLPPPVDLLRIIRTFGWLGAFVGLQKQPETVEALSLYIWNRHTVAVSAAQLAEDIHVGLETFAGMNYAINTGEIPNKNAFGEIGETFFDVVYALEPVAIRFG